MGRQAVLFRDAFNHVVVALDDLFALGDGGFEGGIVGGVVLFLEVGEILLVVQDGSVDVVLVELLTLFAG